MNPDPEENETRHTLEWEAWRDAVFRVKPRPADARLRRLYDDGATVRAAAAYRQ